MEQDDVLDPSENQSPEKEQPTDPPKFESMASKQAKKFKFEKKFKLKKLKSELFDKLQNQNGEPGVMYLEKTQPITDMATRYKLAWKKTYGKQQGWRQKEIDTTLKSGRLSDRDWDNDFVQQVVSLAESDDPLET